MTTEATKTVDVPEHWMANREVFHPGFTAMAKARGVVIEGGLRLPEDAFNELWPQFAKTPAPMPIASIPQSDWPIWVKTVALAKTADDRGVGDTIARTIGPVGGDLFKAWFKKLTGKDCGCSERQELLNSKYTYEESA